jgi:UDP-N-acetylmuramoyl-L-alanyl-D-glutamate--2,6-diaminopimelate ligase
MAKLSEWLEEIEPVSVRGEVDVDVSGIAYDSRKVRWGDLFVCIRGLSDDGHRYLEDARRAGAAAAVVEREMSISEPFTVVRVSNSRRALALLADLYYHRPSRQLAIVGITGTNGKTTTSFLTRSVLTAAGVRMGLIGTVRHWVGEDSVPARNTTPESLDLQELLASMVAQKLAGAVMEVSSHALALDRVVGVEFDVGVFTNLSRDHLDFHQTYEAYRAAKARLFALLAASRKPSRLAVFNVDDPVGREFARDWESRALTYGQTDQADVRASGAEVFLNRIDLEVVHGGEERTVTIPLGGSHNIYNALAAYAVGVGLGLGRTTIEEGLAAAPPVPGRFELVVDADPFSVIVDYAHTPEALRYVLASVKELTPGRVIVVFGCGGDRDRGKRPLMGEEAASIADYTVVTSDNPRSEDPMAIIDEILVGIDRTRSAVAVEPDRRAGIEAALSEARPGDTVVVAGKGHEDYQIMGSKRIHFDDRETVHELLAARSGSSASVADSPHT